MRTFLAGVLGVVSVAGCASAPIRPADSLRLADADARVLAGCYSCLLEARDTYAGLAATRARPLIVGRLFETEVLIGLRQAELALSPTAALERAEALVPELPATVDATFLLDLARAIPPDRLGTPRVTRRQGDRRRQEFAADELAGVFTRLDASTAGLPFLNYLSASLACLADDVGIRTGDVIPTPPDAPPLVRYRVATCPRPRIGPLAALAVEVPEFVEANFFQARVPATAMTIERVAEQRAAYAAAAERFPASPAVLYSVAVLHQTLGDCRTAVASYDALLAVEPDHEEGALQRIVCLGYLARHDEAIAAATRLVDERFDNMGEAMYWRAWNHYTVKRLETARADIDRAMSMFVDARVLALSGMIKYDQGEYLGAEHDLRGSIQMDAQQCIARWYLGLVAFASEEWLKTGEEFEASSSCYRRSVERTENDLRRMREADLDPQFKASQVAGFEAVIAEDRGQEQASYVNAANGFIRAAYADRARDMLKRVTPESAHAEAATLLSRYLDATVGPLPEDAPAAGGGP